MCYAVLSVLSNVLQASSCRMWSSASATTLRTGTHKRSDWACVLVAARDRGRPKVLCGWAAIVRKCFVVTICVCCACVVRNKLHWMTTPADSHDHSDKTKTTKQRIQIKRTTKGYCSTVLQTFPPCPATCTACRALSTAPSACVPPHHICLRTTPGLALTSTLATPAAAAAGEGPGPACSSMESGVQQDCPPTGCWWEEVDITRCMLSFLPSNQDVLQCDLVCRQWAALKVRSAPGPVRCC